MTLFRKLFGGKNKQENASPDLPATEKLFADVSGKIYPYFKQFQVSKEEAIPLPGDLSLVEKQKTYDLPGTSIVFKNICQDLNCLYAIDTGTSFEIIQQSHLEKWEIDHQKIHEIAIENFRNLLTQKLTARGDTNGIMFIIDGNLEAGLVLIDEIWDQFEEQVGEKIVITVPSRDVIMVTGISNRAMIDQFKQTSKRILLEGDYPLSKYLLTRDNSRWILFEEIQIR